MEDLSYQIKADEIDNLLGNIKVKFFQAMRTIMHQRNHFVADDKAIEDQGDMITNIRY